MSEINELIEKRRSIRKFKTEKKVSKEELRALLEAAMLAPSACNTRPWEFIVITRREILDKIAQLHPQAGMCKTAQAAIVVVAIPQYDQGALDFYPQDCAAATQNILLQAVALGLGTCWCGVFPKVERIDIYRQLFDIRDPKIPFNIIAIGIPDEQPARKGFFKESKVTYIE